MAKDPIIDRLAPGISPRDLVMLPCVAGLPETGVPATISVYIDSAGVIRWWDGTPLYIGERVALRGGPAYYILPDHGPHSWTISAPEAELNALTDSEVG